MMDPELLEPYDHLVTIEVLGRAFEVPAGNLLLRQLQFLSDEIGYGKYCWNGECRDCQVECERPQGDGRHWVMACLVKGYDGMKITRLSPEIRTNLSSVLSDTPPPSSVSK
jgi:NADH dehydrogenase/NADH:ubiquinone oxidoreductase subunit G